jgi:hypothetical protein
LTAFTVTGPPDSGIIDLDLMPYWLGYTDPVNPFFFNKDQLQNAVNGFYTFRVKNQSGDYFVTTDYLEVVPPMDLPVIVSPADGAVNVSPNNVTLDWEPVAAADYYRIDLMFLRDGNWHYEPGFPVQLNDTQYLITLPANTPYRLQIRARQNDLFSNMDNEAKSEYRFFITSGG